MTETIRISEIFGPTIQGEGALIGQPTVFVRAGGCDYRCAWCDTPHAVDSSFRNEWTPMTAEEIFSKVRELSGGKPLMVSLSGGNPAIQNFAPLIALGKKEGYRFALETQGSVAQDWFADLDVLTLSPKPPSSGMKTDWGKFDECLKAALPSSPSPCRGIRPSFPSPPSPFFREKGERDQGRGGGGPVIFMKIVIFDDADYKFAKDAAAKYPGLALYLQPGNHTPPPAAIDLDGITKRLRWLSDKVTEDRWFSATVTPQLHVHIWGNQRGV